MVKPSRIRHSPFTIAARDSRRPCPISRVPYMNYNRGGNIAEETNYASTRACAVGAASSRRPGYFEPGPFCHRYFLYQRPDRILYPALRPQGFSAQRRGSAGGSTGAAGRNLGRQCDENPHFALDRKSVV